MKVIKNIRIIVLVAAIAISLICLAPNPAAHGLRVTFVEKNLSSKIQTGEILYKINDATATEEMLQEVYSGIVKFETNKGVKFANIDGPIILGVEKLDPTNLKFGLDIKGGVRAFVKINSSDTDTVKQVISTLQNRINFFGLKETAFRQVDKNYIEISMAGGSSEQLESLLQQQGRFESKIPLLLQVKNNATQIKLDKTYNIEVNENKIRIEGNEYAVNDYFYLSDIKFQLTDITRKSINMTSAVFTGDDIKAVYYDPQRSRIQAVQGGYAWSFSVQISREGASRFAKTTKNLDIVPGSSESYLSSQISFYLDEELLDSLNIVASLKGREETEISITGSAPTMQEAVTERSRLQSILRSGALPVSIEIVQLDSISPNLGEGFLNSAVLAGLTALVGVVIVVSLRYRKPKIVAPMVITAMSEVLIILGISVLIGWTIDVAAVAGIIAAVGTGIDSQIIIIDQTLRGEKTETLREKLRDAFFIIFGAAGTVIAAMIPLMVIGFGTLRGFAITTMIGVLVGILITRPAFGAIVEKLVKD